MNASMRHCLLREGKHEIFLSFSPLFPNRSQFGSGEFWGLPNAAQYYGKLVSGIDRMLLVGATPIPKKFDDRSVGGRSTRNSVRRRVFERCRSIREMEELDRALEGSAIGARQSAFHSARK
jgi:hypothetical protein